MKRGNLQRPKKVQYGLSENAISRGFKKIIPPILDGQYQAGGNTKQN